MKRSRHVVAAVLTALAVGAIVIAVMKTLPAHSSDAAVADTEAAEATLAGVVDTTPEVDPAAIAALARMGEYLRTLKAFQLRADVVTEDVRRDGQKVQIIRAVDLVARRPDRLHVDVMSAQQHRLFFYDGATLTLWAPRSKYYATIPAPPTIGELADKLEAEYGVELPLVDLFRWGTAASNVAAITSAIDIGPSQIDGVTCEQYAFHQEGLDWQVWLQLGDLPLPRRIVITTLTDEARPQHMATYKWNLAPSFNNATFVFEPPTDARKIPIAKVAARSESTTRKK